MPRKTENSQVTSNSHDIGYVLGKMEMLEKKMEDHDKQLELVLEKLDHMSETMSFWKHTIWIFKALAATLPLILASNWEGIATLWKDF